MIVCVCFKLLELFNNNSTELDVWYVTQHDTQEPESRTEIAKLDSRRGLSSFCGSVAENVSMIMMTVHKICFLRCCSNPTHRHRVWVSAKQCQRDIEKPCTSCHHLLSGGLRFFRCLEHFLTLNLILCLACFCLPMERLQCQRYCLV